MKLYQKIKELWPEYQIAISDTKIHIIYKWASIVTADKQKWITPKTIDILDDFIEREAKKYYREYEIMSFINFPIKYIKIKVRNFLFKAK